MEKSYKMQQSQLGRPQALHGHSIASYATPNAFFASYELGRIPHGLIPQSISSNHEAINKAIGEVEGTSWMCLLRHMRYIEWPMLWRIMMNSLHNEGIYE